MKTNKSKIQLFYIDNNETIFLNNCFKINLCCYSKEKLY